MYARDYGVAGLTDVGSLQYYKPWQLRPGDERVIREQIEDAEATVAREVAEFEARYPPEAFVREDIEPAQPAPKEGQVEENKEPERPQQQVSEPEQPSAPEKEAVSTEPQEAANTENVHPEQDQSSKPTTTDAPTNGTSPAEQEQADVHHDDGGEVVEDNEDTVIY